MGQSLRYWLFSIVATVIAPAAVHADDEPLCVAADAAIARGLELRASHADAGALIEFKKAQRMCPGARAMGQIALAEQALGRWVEAEEHLNQALSATEDPWIVKNRPVLESTLATIGEHLGHLEVVTPHGSPPGAELFFNERRLGRLPMGQPARVVAGVSTLEVRAAGHQTLSRPVKIVSGGLAREVVELTALGPGEGATGAATARSQPLRTTLGWVGLPVGVIILAGGIAAHVIRERNAAEWNDDGRCLFVDYNKDRGGNCGGDRDTALLAQDLAVAGYVIGGAISVASAALLLWPSRRERPPATALRFGPGPGAIGLSCAGSF